MAIADFLKTVGGDLAKAGKVAGTVLAPVGKAVAEEESGQLPELQKEKRQKQSTMEAAGIDAKAKELESQLEMGRKYGTLTQEQQQQYVKSITDLYSHPSQMGTLVQKLHKAVHPGGATYQHPSTPLKDATPEGGTVAADTANAKELADARAHSNYVNFKGPHGEIVAVDVAHQEPPAGYVKAGQESLAPTKYQQKTVESKKLGGKVLANYDQTTGKYYEASGKEIEDAAPYVKPSSGGSVSTQYASLYGKKLLADSGKGPKLTPEEDAQLQGLKSAITLGPATRAETMARASAQYNLTQVQDPATGADVWVPRMDVLHASQGGNPMMASRNSQRAMLAASALQQVHTIKDILEAHPELVGPIAGRENAIEQMGGIQSPEFARFKAAAAYLAEHGSGVFGSRNIATVEDLKNTITNPAFNIEALKSTLDQAEKTNQMFLNPQGAQVPNPGAKPVGQILPKTGAHKIGETKNFSNGKTGVWDGQGWVAQ